MKHLGWNLNELQNPPSFHLCLTNCHREDIIDNFIKDVKTSLQIIVNQMLNNEIEDSNVGSSIYGTTQKVPSQDIVDRVVVKYLNSIHL